MKKIALVTAILCVLAAPAFAAGKKEPLPLNELFASISKCVVSVRADEVRDRGIPQSFQSGLVLSGSNDEAVIVTSMRPIAMGYQSVSLCSDKSRLSKKCEANSNIFISNNLLYAKFKKLTADKYGQYSDREVTISEEPLTVGQKVYVVRSNPNASQKPIIIPATVGAQVKPKGRNYSLYKLNLSTMANPGSTLYGAGVFNNFGELVGIMNTDPTREDSGLEEAYPDFLMAHPSKTIPEGVASKDKLTRKMLPITQQGVITGYWLPVRFSPLTKAWRDVYDLDSEAFGYIVSAKYPECSGIDIQIGDLLIAVDGIQLGSLRGLTDDWDGATLMSEVFRRYIPASRGSSPTPKLTLLRQNLSEPKEITATLPQLPNIQNSAGMYGCEKIDCAFRELDTPFRIMRDLPDSVSGIIAVGSMQGKINIAYFKGLVNSIVKQVNGRSFNNITEFQKVMEEEIATGRPLMFLCLDIGSFRYKFVTLEVAR
ncbi:MAG: hypothetical protein WC712_07055 [Candidatus Brocadiia bacterium]